MGKYHIEILVLYFIVIRIILVILITILVTITTAATAAPTTPDASITINVSLVCTCLGWCPLQAIGLEMAGELQDSPASRVWAHKYARLAGG